MTAIDPRTILANAIAHLRHKASGWTRHPYGWTNDHSGADILIDSTGIHLHHGDTTTLVDFDEEPAGARPDYWAPNWTDAARAVDHLCTEGLLPHRLSTGYQLAAQQWAKRVAEAEEAKRLADQQIKELAKQLRTLANNSVGVLIDQAAEVRDLRQQLADATAQTGGNVKAVAA